MGVELLPLLEGVPVLIVTSCPKRVESRAGVRVVEKGPAWATSIEAALVQVLRGR